MRAALRRQVQVSSSQHSDRVHNYTAIGHQHVSRIKHITQFVGRRNPNEIKTPTNAITRGVEPIERTQRPLKEHNAPPRYMAALTP